jgi:hypothetical protein
MIVDLLPMTSHNGTEEDAMSNATTITGRRPNDS